MTGLIVGVLVGVVSGVNETKSKADDKRLLTSLRRRSRYVIPFVQSKAEAKLPKAPLLKTTNNRVADQIYDAFHRYIERQNSPYMGTLIIYTKDDQIGEVINLLDRYNWEQYPEGRTNSYQTKQAYIKSHNVYNNHHVCAAVFKDLLANKAYVIWSEMKQPAYAVVAPGEVTLIDWLQ